MSNYGHVFTFTIQHRMLFYEQHQKNSWIIFAPAALTHFGSTRRLVMVKLNFFGIFGYRETNISTVKESAICLCQK